MKFVIELGIRGKEFGGLGVLETGRCCRYLAR